MFAGLAYLALAGGQSSPLESFRASYAARSSNLPTAKLDPAISKDLDVLISFVSSGLSRNPHANDKEIDRWLAPFRKVADPKNEGEAPVDEYHSLSVDAYSAGKYRFVVARMGAVSRTIGFDGTGKKLALPRRFFWNYRWQPTPHAIADGLVLMEQSSIQAAGNRVGIRLDWLKVDLARAVNVGSFEGQTTLDLSSASIKPNRVSVHTIDDPKSFYVSAATPIFERITTWTVRNRQPVLASIDLQQLSLRSVDDAIYKAWHAKHPTALQAKIRRQCSKETDLGSWKEVKTPHGLRVHASGIGTFELRSTGGRLLVTDILK